MADTTTTLFRVSLKKSVCREIEVRNSATLYALAGAAVEAFGFDFDHAFGFYSETKGSIYDSKIKYELFADMEDEAFDVGKPGSAKPQSVRKNRVGTVFPVKGDKMIMLFDYGDNWNFLVEAIGKGEVVPGKRYPVQHASKGKAPEQYPSMDDD